MRYAAILCGGSGSRLWPASRRDCPKQFIDVLGCGKTLVQMAAENALKCVPQQNILAVVNDSHVDLLTRQLPFVGKDNIIAETARRGTSLAVLRAAKTVADRDPEATMAILPSTNLVVRSDKLAEAIRSAFDFVESDGAVIAIAIRPSEPMPGCLYIQTGPRLRTLEDSDTLYEVQTIAGKPSDDNLARVLNDSNEFLVHTGILVFRAANLCERFRSLAPEIWDLAGKCEETGEADELQKAYSNAVNISIADALLEKLDDLKVLETSIGLTDLGNWNALYRASPKMRTGNVARNVLLQATDCEGTIFYSQSGKLILASGLKDFIVADTPDAILICPRDEEEALKDTIKSLRSSFGDKFM